MVSVCRWGVVVIKDIMVYFSKKMSVVSETRRDAVGLSSKVENKNKNVLEKEIHNKTRVVWQLLDTCHVDIDTCLCV